MPRTFNCGRGCTCTGCGGCIRSGSTCHIFPATNGGANLVDVRAQVRPIDEKYDLEQVVTAHLGDLTLADAAYFLSTLVDQDLAVPADLAYDQVTLEAEDVSLGSLVDDLGLLRR